ncbi:hypothetical protein [Actinoplanes sp. NPDC049118]|uniref:hypothetical protein n=1 Tax=Actinoplanes sp. NPDC049118 TaxID=3155769 RepID=UPI0033E9A89F
MREYAGRITDILLGAFIPARTRLYAADRYTPAQTARWLAATADHLRWQSEHRQSNSDIVLQHWWRVAGEERVKRAHAWVTATLVVTAAAVTGISINGGVGAALDNVRYYLANVRVEERGYVLAGLVFVMLFTYAPYRAARVARRNHIEPAQINPRQIFTSRGRRQLAARLPTTAIGTLLALPAFELAFQNTQSYGIWLALGLIVGMVVGLEPIGAVAINPRDPLRNDLIVWLGYGLTGGVLVALTNGRTYYASLTYGLGPWFVAGIAIALATILLIPAAGSASLRYFVAVGLAAYDGKMPLRFGAFLEWANRSGILRITGNAYQFRHSELRDWLQRDSPRQAAPSTAAHPPGRH